MCVPLKISLTSVHKDIRHKAKDCSIMSSIMLDTKEDSITITDLILLSVVDE